MIRRLASGRLAPRLLASSLFAATALLAAGPALAQTEFRSCLSGLRGEAAAKGVSGPTFDAATNGLEPDRTILDLMDNQPEFKTPIWDYLAALVDDERVQDGRAAMRQWSRALAAAEARYGVDRHVIAGVWGVESNFGKDIGGRPLVQSLATLSCYASRRRSYFTGELMATLKIIEKGDIEPAHLRGSWAGAFGHTQFMPSTFQRLAVDLDGDGRRDIVDSVPDALGSTANFLKKAGWVSGLPWGYEVRLPRGFNRAALGRKNKRPVSAWAAAGVTRIDGHPLSGSYPAGIIAPAGLDGPAFLVTRNFDAVYSYNAAESYGLAIALLGDRLQGLPGIRTAWPTDDPPLSRAERRELQRLLTARGYDVGEPDGRVGQKTRDAIKDVERRIGRDETGRPGGKVLEALRRG
jgi:lytic murein transglycosylase